MIDHIDDILDSDLLERYVLGDVSIEERMKVDMLRVEHAQVRQRLREFEITMERTAMDNAVQLPYGLKDKLMQSIHEKASGQESKVQAENATKKKSDNATPVRSRKSWYYAAAAAIIGAGAMYGLQQSRLNTAQQTINTQQAELAAVKADCDAMALQYAMIAHRETRPVVLANSSTSQKEEVIIYWNEATGQSLLRVLALPKLAETETYQLWADVDGEMLSLGIFDASVAEAGYVSMGYLDNAESLNITIEPKGGSDNPNVERLRLSQSI